MILRKDRDSRFITIRRGGTLTDSDHRLLACLGPVRRVAMPWLRHEV